MVDREDIIIVCAERGDRMNLLDKIVEFVDLVVEQMGEELEKMHQESTIISNLTETEIMESSSGLLSFIEGME